MSKYFTLILMTICALAFFSCGSPEEKNPYWVKMSSLSENTPTLHVHHDDHVRYYDGSKSFQTTLSEKQKNTLLELLTDDAIDNYEVDDSKSAYSKGQQENRTDDLLKVTVKKVSYDTQLILYVDRKNMRPNVNELITSLDSIVESSKSN